MFRFLLSLLCFSSLSLPLLAMTDEEERNGPSVNRGARPSTEQPSTEVNPLENFPLEDFPDEILTHILPYLNQRDVPGVTSVSQHFNRLMNDNQLWYSYAQRAWTIVGEDYSSERGYKALIKEHCTPSFTVLQCNGNEADFLVTNYWPTNISANDSAIAGYAQLYTDYANDVGVMRAFRWTREEGVRFLDTLNGQGNSWTSGISNDGSTIVGDSDTVEGRRRAFRWTREGRMQPLGALNGGTANCAIDLSGDGSIIVGYADDGSGGDNKRRAFRWTREKEWGLWDV